MKQTIGLSDFRDAFHRAGRADQFSHEALELLFDFFEEMDADRELDVIAICCDFVEATPDDLRQDYTLTFGEVDADDDAALLDALNDETSVVGQTSMGAFVFQVF